MEMIPIGPREIELLGAVGFDCGGTIYAVPEMQLEMPIFTRSNMGGIRRMGAFSYISNTGIHNQVDIGRYCSISPSVNIGFGEHPVDWLSTTPAQWSTFFPQFALPQYQPIRPHPLVTVGHDVWIGTGVYIRAGVTIGNGVVIGAQSVISKDVPDYAVVVGNPMQIKRLRFKEAIVERLLRLAWWRYKITDLAGCPFHDIDRAVVWLEEAEGEGRLTGYSGEVLDCERVKKIIA